MASILTDAELAYIRAALLELLPDECYILTATETRNASGGVVETWGTATVSTPCRFDPMTGTQSRREGLAAGAVTAFHGYTVTLPSDTVITAKNRLAWNGQTFNVTAVDSAKSWPGTRRLLVEVI